MNRQLLRDLMIGLTTGWTVVIFSDTYYEFKKWIISMFDGDKTFKFVFDLSLPLVFFLLMCMAAVFAVRLGKRI